MAVRERATATLDPTRTEHGFTGPSMEVGKIFLTADAASAAASAAAAAASATAAANSAASMINVSQPRDDTLTALAALDGVAGLLEQTGVDVFAKRALGVAATTSVLTRADGDGRYQSLDATLTAFAAFDDTAGLLEQTGLDTFVKRPLGTAAPTSVLTRADGDGRYLATADYQPLDADLSALAVLSGTHTIYHRSGENVWTPVLMGSNMTFIGSTLNATGFAAPIHTHAQSDILNLVNDLAAKAPLASPAFTGIPTAPTASTATSTTQIATTAFVAAVLSSVSGGTVFEAPNDGQIYGRKNLAWATIDAADKVSKAGDTMTGQLVLPGSPTLANQAVTKGYVDTEVTILTNTKFAKSGGTLSGPVTIDAPAGGFTIDANNPRIFLDKLNGTGGLEAGIYNYTAGVLRWVVSTSNGDLEGTSNFGSNFAIYRYADDGAFLGTALSISRQTGVVSGVIFNVTDAYQIDGRAVVGSSGAYTFFYEPGTSGEYRLLLGNSGDAGNYYDNTTHTFRSALHNVTFATLTAGGLAVSGAGSFGASGSFNGDIRIPLLSRIYLYDHGTTSRAWLSTDGNGHMEFNTGVSVPALRARILNSGETQILSGTQSTSTSTGALYVAGGVGIGGSLHIGGPVLVIPTIPSEASLTNPSALPGTMIMILNYGGSGEPALAVHAGSGWRIWFAAE